MDVCRYEAHLPCVFQRIPGSGSDHRYFCEAASEYSANFYTVLFLTFALHPWLTYLLIAIEHRRQLFCIVGRIGVKEWFLWTGKILDATGRLVLRKPSIFLVPGSGVEIMRWMTAFDCGEVWQKPSLMSKLVLDYLFCINQYKFCVFLLILSFCLPFDLLDYCFWGTQSCGNDPFCWKSRIRQDSRRIYTTVLHPHMKHICSFAMKSQAYIHQNRSELVLFKARHDKWRVQI